MIIEIWVRHNDKSVFTGSMLEVSSKEEAKNEAERQARQFAADLNSEVILNDQRILVGPIEIRIV